MRLINIYTLDIEEFFGQEVPSYFILSHQWEGKEITYKELVKAKNRDTLGYKKVKDFCTLVQKYRQPSEAMTAMIREEDRINTDYATLRRNETAAREGISWVWIDTCCIDKRSSAELSEAINSMFSWYRGAVACFVYLCDVRSRSLLEDRAAALRNSSWFKRGWTLQELLAPNVVIFCNNSWETFGCLLAPKQSVKVFHLGQFERAVQSEFGPLLTEEVSRVTGIARDYLEGSEKKWRHGNTKSIYLASIGERMSWAADRQTSRQEDRAYSLLGIFSINMPLLYGEGSKAFLRLQEEIIKRSTDKSIFAWQDPDYYSSMFAHSPGSFRSSALVSKYEIGPPFELTNRGLRIQAKYITVQLSLREMQTLSGHGYTYYSRKHSVHLLPFNRDSGGNVMVIAVKEKPTRGSEYEQYERVGWLNVDKLLSKYFSSRTILLPERTFYIDAWPEVR